MSCPGLQRSDTDDQIWAIGPPTSEAAERGRLSSAEPYAIFTSIVHEMVPACHGEGATLELNLAHLFFFWDCHSNVFHLPGVWTLRVVPNPSTNSLPDERGFLRYTFFAWCLLGRFC